MPRQARPQDLRNQVRAASWDGRHRYTPTAFAASRTISSGGTSRRCLYTPTVTERVDELPAPLLPERAGGRVEHVAPASVAFEGTVYGPRSRPAGPDRCRPGSAGTRCPDQGTLRQGAVVPRRLGGRTSGPSGIVAPLCPVPSKRCASSATAISGSSSTPRRWRTGRLSLPSLPGTRVRCRGARGLHRSPQKSAAESSSRRTPAFRSRLRASSSRARRVRFVAREDYSAGRDVSPARLAPPYSQTPGGGSHDYGDTYAGRRRVLKAAARIPARFHRRCPASR